MSYRKILALKLRALGDTVLMTAPLLELKRAFPRAEIHVAAVAPWASLLEHHPAVSRIWMYERHRERTSRAKAAAALALRLRREGFDCVVNFHASPSSSMVAFATGARVRSIHFHGHKDKNRHSTVEVPGKGILKPIIERDMDAVRALGITIPEGRLPEIFLAEGELGLARSWLEQRGLTGPVLALGLGASRPTKRWPVERFAGLALAWCEKRAGSALAITGPGEETLLGEFFSALDSRISASGPNATAARSRIVQTQGASQPLALRELASLLKLSAAYAGNDTGPKHMAVAVGTPSVTVFGPEHPFEWHPYPQNLHPYLFVEGLACRRDALPGMPAWCGLHECTIEKHRCMRDIPVAEVLEAILKVSRA